MSDPICPECELPVEDGDSPVEDGPDTLHSECYYDRMLGIT